MLRYLRFSVFLWAAGAWPAHGADAPGLEDGFRHPPPEARPCAWWHWINGNVTKEGIRADLEAMKNSGMGGAQIMDVSIYTPPGPARYHSDIWYDDMRYAMQTAAELGLDLQVANADGWSQSGGPWITPELSMKEVTWSEMNVTGPMDFKAALPEPPSKLNFYRDIAVYAVPDDESSDEKPDVTVSAPNPLGASLIDENASKVIAFAKDDPAPTATFVYAKPVERRTVEITFDNSMPRGRIAGSISGSADGKTFTKLRDFQFDGALGSVPKLAVSFPATQALAFRCVEDKPASHAPWHLVKMRFTDATRVENLRAKTVMAELTSVIPMSAATTATVGAIAPEQCLNLTPHLDQNGVLDWHVPAGRWTILRMGYTATGSTNHPAQPEGSGLECDKMDAHTVAFQFDQALGRLLKENRASIGKSLSGIMTDSWEAGPQNWTADFPAEFQARRGYDLMPFLPALAGRILISPAETEAFLDDFRRTVSDLVTEKYHGTLREESHKYGLKFWSETYAGVCFNEYQAGAQTDEIMGEFWVSGIGNDDRRVKKMASLAHVLGRSTLSAESFTATPENGRWLQVPSNLKPVGDLAFAQGLNKMFLHSFTMQPRSDLRPGFSLGRYGTHFGRQSTWWPYAKSWIDYLSRCQFLLRQGRFQADFLCLHSGDIDFLVTEPMPKLPFGYQYDYIDPLQLAQTTAAKGLIQIPDGATYRALILPAPWVADLATLQHLQKLVAGGAVLIGAAPIAPLGHADLEDRATWQALVDQLWPHRLPPDTNIDEQIKSYVKSSGLEPDLQVHTDSGKGINWIHRELSDGDLYFLANPGDTPLQFQADFRVAKKRPELWDAVMGRIVTAPVFNETANGMSIDLSLDAGGSIFVIFRKPLPARWATSIADASGVPERLGSADLDKNGSPIVTTAGPFKIAMNDGTISEAKVDPLENPITLNAAWQVQFQTPGGAAFTRDFPTLQSWSASPDPLVRYFSGPATYKTTFTVPTSAAGQKCRLDLGRVCDLADLKINGQPGGTLWTPPFATDITPLLKPGVNTLEITIVNRWVNRLVGDEQFPPDAQYQVGGTKFTIGRLLEFPAWYHDPKLEAKRQRTTFVTWNLYDKDSPLLDSGLIGPVTLHFARVLALAQPSQN